MANVELVAFETKIEKYCADWVLEVTKVLAANKTAVKDLSRALRDKIKALPLPKDTDDKELSRIPDRVNEILKQESVRLAGIVDMSLYSKVDLKAKKFIVDGHEVGGLFNKL